jgi:hypothetical protein
MLNLNSSLFTRRKGKGHAKKSALLLLFLLGKEIKKTSSGWLPRVIFFKEMRKQIDLAIL